MIFFRAVLLGFLLFSQSLIAAETFRDQIKVYDRDDIHSIHKKLFTKEGRHEFTLGAGGITNNGGYGLVVLQYQYHLLENFGIEAATGGYGFQMGDSDKLFFYQGSLSFSPLYGKVSLFTWAVANFDIYFVGGGGVVRYSGRGDGSSAMGNVGIGGRFFINDYLSVKLEFRDYIYKFKLPAANSEIFNSFAVTAGLSIMMPFEQAY